MSLIHPVQARRRTLCDLVFAVERRGVIDVTLWRAETAALAFVGVIS